MEDTYRGESADRMKLLNADTRETDVRMIGLALKNALTEFAGEFRDIIPAEAFERRASVQ